MPNWLKGLPKNFNKKVALKKWLPLTEGQKKLPNKNKGRMQNNHKPKGKEAPKIINPKLEEATNELKGFKNFNQIGVDEAIEKIANSPSPQSTATQIEPKQASRDYIKKERKRRG